MRLWDVATGQCLRTFTGHTGWVNSVALSDDGRFALSGGLEGTVRLWDVATGQCLRSFEGHTEEVDWVALSREGQFALSMSSRDQTVRSWFLDWELEEREPAEWDDGARSYLEVFLTLQTPFAAAMPQDTKPDEAQITAALTRRGRPVWTEDDFQRLLFRLGCAGYGWLRPEGVRRELERMAADWHGPPPLSGT
jgi:hypothetical protein